MLTLYGHAFSSYTQKALIALYEKALAFDFREIAPNQPENNAVLAAMSPIGKFPLLVTGDDKALPEATVIIEYCDGQAPGDAPLIPADTDAALTVRMLDRLFDNYVMTPTSAIVADYLRPDGSRDPFGVQQAEEMLTRAYDWLETALVGKTWAAGETFTLADCAAAPSLFYADWVHPIGAARPVLSAYRVRLNARPSFARCIEEARSFRPYFPPGAPDRD